MEWRATWEDPFAQYVWHFRELIGDRRTWVTFGAVLRGIIISGSLVCKRIAAHSVVLAKVAKDGGQRVIRLATGESTRRSQLSAEDVIEKLCSRGVSQLSQSETNDLWLIGDGCDLRKPYAREMPALMKVRDLDGKLVRGYRTLNVLGVSPQRRGILYHRLFSTKEGDFSSESAEVQKALETVSRAVQPLLGRMTVTWILDRGFDDIAVWRTIWEQEGHLLCRISHDERRVKFMGAHGRWRSGDIRQACRTLQGLALAETEMMVCVGRQKTAKLQSVVAEIKACPLRLTYESNVRRGGAGEKLQQPLWLVEIEVRDSSMQPWLLVTDWPVTDEQSALRVLRMYRQRWAVEDSFKFIKTCLGWEEVQLLDLEGIRTLVALAWVAAGFLYELGITLEWPEVQLLARLGGWEARNDRPPGKQVLLRGLQRLMDMSVTNTILQDHIAKHGPLSPRLSALIGLPPPEL
jgi:hypothetical protein